MVSEFNTYCLLILGNIKDAGVILKQITEEEIKYIEGKGFYMATFASVLSPSELKNCFTGKNSSVIVFKIDGDVSSVELSDEGKHNHLFEDVEQLMNKNKGLDKDLGFMMSSDKEEVKEIGLNNLKIEIGNMDKGERKTLMDKIFDKGVNNLTSDDKEILEILAGND